MHIKIRNLGLEVALIAALYTTASAQTAWFVDADADAAADCTSWADACPDLQSALDLAQPGDEVWVAEGIYIPSQLMQPGDPRSATFRLAGGVGIYGGFAGNESTREQRAGLFEETILSGDLAGDDGPEFSNRADNAYHVVIALDVDASAVLDGFAVRGGYADGQSQGGVPESHDQGSAVNIFYSTPSIAHCTFIDNWSATQGAVNDHGGAALSNCIFQNNGSGGAGAGLYIHSAGETTVAGCQFLGNVTFGLGGGVHVAGNFKSLPESFSDCFFAQNQANEGGGLYCAMAGAPTLTGCSFVGNQAQHGGAVYDNASNAEFTDCTAESNAAANGAGFYSRGLGSLSLSECTLRGNHASAAGGGIYFTNTAAPHLTDCVLEENTAVDGGGLYNGAGNPTLTGCTFLANAATNGAGLYSHGGGSLSLNGTVLTNNQATNSGGGVYFELANGSAVTDCTFTGNEALAGGGLYDNASSPQISGCLFEGNLAEDGAGVYSHGGSSPTLTDCTLTMNQAILGGGGMWNRENSPTVTNCVFLLNTATEGAGLWSLDGDLVVDASVFASNATTGGQGGAGLYVVLGSALVTECTFSENTSEGEGFIVGGGMLSYLSSVIVERCTFSGNASDFGGGGMYNEFNNTTSVTQSTFTNNTALYGGAVYNLLASPQIRNSIFNANSAQGLSTSVGGAVYGDLNSNAVIANCTFSGNFAPDGGSAVVSFQSSPALTNCILWNNDPEPIQEDLEFPTTVNSSDIQGGWTGLGSQNIDADPLFVAPLAGDLHLSPESPCINAGDNSVIQQDDVDIDGQQRIMSGRVDLGADEVLSQCTMDLSADGVVDSVDLAILLAAWGPGSQSSADLSNDGAVNAFDLALLLGAWGFCG